MKEDMEKKNDTEGNPLLFKLYDNLSPEESLIKINKEDLFLKYNNISSSNLLDVANFNNYFTIGQGYQEAYNEFEKEKDKTVWYFIDHPEIFKCVAKLISSNDNSFIYEMINGSQIEINLDKHNKRKPVSEKILQSGTTNLDMIGSTNIPLMIYNISKLFYKGFIYYNRSGILISINPYRSIELYSDEFKSAYRQNSNLSGTAPHIYSIVEHAYTNLRNNFQSQIIIIEGITGSGKTVNFTHCIDYLNWICEKRIDKNDLLTKSFEILEAFGNAKSLSNENSSRFIKFVEIHFDSYNNYCGCKINTFVLERGRICYQNKMNRNFHIFYYLCRGASSEIKKILRLEDVDSYEILNYGGTTYTAQGNDKEKFLSLDFLLNSVLGYQNTLEVYNLLSIILHLGNIRFRQPDLNKPCIIENLEEIKHLSILLNIHESLIVEALTTLTMSNFTKYFTAVAANEARNAWMKHIYSKIFAFIVASLNAKMEIKNKNTRFIGILDSHGFEILESNSLEELIVNYSSEKLIHFFLDSAIKNSQNLYEEEGVPFEKFNIKDNLEIINFFDDKKNGLFTLIEDEIRMPNHNDERLLSKINTRYKKLKNIYLYDIKEPGKFGVRHSFAELYYTGSRLLEKSKDEMSINILELISNSNNSFIQTLFKFEKSKAISGISSRPSLGIQFAKEFKEMIQYFKNCPLHYIKCISPNQERTAFPPNIPFICQQLINCGMEEIVKMAELQYSYYTPYLEFSLKYPVLFRSEKVCDQNAVQKIIMSNPDLSNLTFCYGKNRLFFNFPEIQALNLQEKKEIQKSLQRLRCYIKRKIAIKLKNKLKAADLLLKNAMKTENISEIQKALLATENLDYELYTRKLAQDKIIAIQKRDEEIKQQEEERKENEKKIKSEQLRKEITEEESKKIEMIEEVNKIFQSSKQGLVSSSELNEAVEKATILQIDQNIIDESKLLLEKQEKEKSLMGEFNKVKREGELEGISIGHAKEIRWDNLEQFANEISKFKPFSFNETQEIEERTNLLILIRKATQSIDINELKKLVESWKNIRGFFDIDAVSNYLRFIEYMNELEDEETKLKLAINNKDKKKVIFLLEKIKHNKHEVNKGILKEALSVAKQMLLIDFYKQEAFRTMNPKNIDLAIEQLESYNPEDKDIEELKKMKGEVEAILIRSSFAINYMNTVLMEENLFKASEIGFSHSYIEIQRALLYEMNYENVLSCKQKSAELTENLKMIAYFKLKANESQFDISNIPKNSNSNPEKFKKNDYELLNFPRLKKPSDFVKVGSPFNAAFSDELTSYKNFLNWTDTPISKTLTKLKDSKKESEILPQFKNIMCFMGDYPHSNPNNCAQSLMFFGISNEYSRDEIYCEILKQMRKNSNNISLKRGWLLLSLCLQSFAPQEIFPYLEYFIRKYCPLKLNDSLLIYMYEKKYLRKEESLGIDEVRNIISRGLELKPIDIYSLDVQFDPSYREMGIHVELLRHINALRPF